MTDLQYLLFGISLAALIYYLFQLAGAAAIFIVDTFDTWSRSRTIKTKKENEND